MNGIPRFMLSTITFVWIGSLPSLRASDEPVRAETLPAAPTLSEDTPDGPALLDKKEWGFVVSKMENWTVDSSKTTDQLWATFDYSDPEVSVYIEASPLPDEDLVIDETFMQFVYQFASAEQPMSLDLLDVRTFKDHPAGYFEARSTSEGVEVHLNQWVIKAHSRLYTLTIGYAESEKAAAQPYVDLFEENLHLVP